MHLRALLNRRQTGEIASFPQNKDPPLTAHAVIRERLCHR